MNGRLEISHLSGGMAHRRYPDKGGSMGMNKAFSRSSGMRPFDLYVTFFRVILTKSIPFPLDMTSPYPSAVSFPVVQQRADLLPCRFRQHKSHLLHVEAGIGDLPTQPRPLLLAKTSRGRGGGNLLSPPVLCLSCPAPSASH